MGRKKLPKLLIVDDELEVANMLKRYFSAKNYSVFTVTDGAIAYNELKRDIYDVCLLDLGMPFKSGMEILKEIGQDDEISTAIIIVTGNNDIPVIIEMMRHGAYNYIQKPFRMEELGIAVENAVKFRMIKKENISNNLRLKQEVDKKTAEIKKAYMDIIDAVVHSIEIRDPYTGGHSNLVSEIAAMIGEEMRLKEEQLEELRIGGILHDIGKIGISDSILRKPDKLTEEEYEQIKEHPKIGYNILKDITSLKKVMPSILYHQERYDGDGYPGGLKGKEIPLEGRILAVADTFAAMITDRPYRKAMSPDSAYKEIMDNSGKQFDPDIAVVFAKLWEKDIIKNFYNKRAKDL